MPVPVSFVVKKGSNRRATVAASMPLPLSSTFSRAYSPGKSVVWAKTRSRRMLGVSMLTARRPFLASAWMALVHRFITIWWSWVASAMTKTGSEGSCVRSSMPPGSVTRRSSSASVTARPSSTGRRSRRCARLYIRIWSTSEAARAAAFCTPSA